MLQKKQTFFKTCLLISSMFFGGASLFGEVVSTSGNVNFNIDDSGFNEMVLSANGLGIGDNLIASSNLEVQGNSIITKSLSVGSTASFSSNLHISGTLEQSYQEQATTTTIGNHSVVMADSSSGNIQLTLPTASTVEGRLMEIKKTSITNVVEIIGGGNLDGMTGYRLSSGNLGSLQLISASGNWHVLSVSRADSFH